MACHAFLGDAEALFFQWLCKHRKLQPEGVTFGYSSVLLMLSKRSAVPRQEMCKLSFLRMP